MTLVRYSVAILFVATVIPYVCGKSNLPRQLEANAGEIPPKPYPCVSFDIYTQKGGMGSGTFGGIFGPDEDVVLDVEIEKDSVPVENQTVTFEIVGPINSYQNISVLLRTVTNSSGIGSTVLKIPLTPEHTAEIITGTWTAQAQIGLDIDTVGDTMDFEVAFISPEFPTSATLLLAFILVTATTIILKRSTR